MDNRKKDALQFPSQMPEFAGIYKVCHAPVATLLEELETPLNPIILRKCKWIVTDIWSQRMQSQKNTTVSLLSSLQVLGAVCLFLGLWNCNKFNVRQWQVGWWQHNKKDGPLDKLSGSDTCWLDCRTTINAMLGNNGLHNVERIKMRVH